MTKAMFVLSVAAVLTGASFCTSAEEKGDVGKMLSAAKVTLQQGLTASESHGKPISGKFEVEDGKLQLSVYTEKSGKFSEVVVDYTTGKVSKAEAITEGDDLAAAKSQSAAVAKAKKSLKSAVDQAEASAAGFRAVSVSAKISQGHPVAEVVLSKGAGQKSVTEPLE